MSKFWLNNTQTIGGEGTFIEASSAMRSINGYQLKDENSAITGGFPDVQDININVPATKSIYLQTDGTTRLEINDSGHT